MPKTTSGRRKGVQRRIPKHRVGSREAVSGLEVERNETKGFRFCHLSRAKYFWIGEKCFEILLAGCKTFNLVGFTRTQNGEYVSLSRKGKICHYAATTFLLTICVQKVWLTTQVLLYEQLRMESFMCLCVALIYVVDVVMSLGVVLNSKRTMDLLNSWSNVPDFLNKVDSRSEFHPLSDRSACLKTVANALVGQGCALAVAVLSIVMSDLPVFLFSMAESVGLLSGGLLPKWAWRVIFALLEWLMVLPMVLVGTLSPSFLYMENGALVIYLKYLRQMNVRCLKSRRRLEQMYVEFELFNRIAQAWIRFYFPPYIFGLSTAVILAAFISIRYTELPLILYIFCPYTAMTLLVLIFWQSLDMNRVIRASEDMLGGLWQHEAPYFRGMTRAKRVQLMKRSRAMRPVVFLVADCEFSMNLPINTWDEIVNQTLFLLSL